ncbi:MAG: glycerol-3-phosphate 1-O-acyltransferase PlsY [Herpetosiphon sp.]
MALTTIVTLFGFGYLIGAIPFSFLIARMLGVDLRKVGSGNTGASNVWRSCGFTPFVVALMLDMSKGCVPTFVAFHTVHASPVVTVATGICAMLGHMFPVFLRFKGGKAVATAAGVLLALQPGLVLLSAVVWSAVYKLKGYPSLSSMVATFTTAVAATWMASVGYLAAPFAMFVWLALAVVVYMHRSNIQRLLHGQEMGIGPRAK